MGKVVRWSHWFRKGSDQRHYSHRYACAVETLVDAGFFNDAVTSATHAARPRPKLVVGSSRGAASMARPTRAEVA